MMTEGALIPTIAVLGGTGKEGSALAVRWALNGYKVIIGSRSAEKAAAAAAEINAELGAEYLIGTSNQEAAEAATTVVLSVPYDAHRATLESVAAQLKGKVLIDLTVPLKPPAVTTVNIPEGKSACLEAQALLGSDVAVVAAFQNVSAVKLKDPNNQVDCDVLLCADNEDAKATALHLVEAAGMRGIDAGPLANAVAVEALTPVLLYINKRYKVKGAGIRITGIETL
jgi:NADPH-dependent F420 reductase